MKVLLIFSLLVISLTSCPSAGAISSDTEEPELPLYTRKTGRTYYVATHGDDDNDGLSASSPWQTIEKLNSSLYDFRPGDTILLNRGDEFKGDLEPSRGTEVNWIKYSAYGSGEKPLITGSLTLKNEADWVLYRGNIWRSALPMKQDIGALFMNDDSSIIGERKWSLDNLIDDGDFFKDPSMRDNYLYLYCRNGSPALFYSNIEAAKKKYHQSE